MSAKNSRKHCRKNDIDIEFDRAPFVFPLVRETNRNECFRRVIWTGDLFQLALMSLPCSVCTGTELHENTDQFIFITRGTAKIVFSHCEGKSDWEETLTAGCCAIVPAGTYHNITNIGSSTLKLFTIYAPPVHAPKTVHRTKKDAENEWEH